MGKPPPDPKKIAQAWIYRTQGRSFPWIGEKMGFSYETARTYARLGREAMSYAALYDVAVERERTVEDLDTLRSWMQDRYDEGADPERIALVILKVLQERAKLHGLYAPQRLAIENDPRDVTPDPAVMAAVRDLQLRSPAEEDEHSA